MSTNRQAVLEGTSSRRIAIAAGMFYLITHITSVAALVLYGPLLNSTSYTLSSEAHMQVMLGAFFEVILAFAIIGTAVALFPVVRKYSESFALGYVGLRTLEAGIIVIGIIPLLVAMTLRQQLTGSVSTDTVSLMSIGHVLVAFHNWTFLLGPSFTSGMDTVLMAYLMYRSGLVPRFIPVLGLIGGPLVFASATAVLFGLIGQYSTGPAITALPEFAWELTLAIWLIVRGFNPSAIASGSAKTATNELVSAI